MGKAADVSIPKEGERFTLEQWRSWPEGDRWELIGGIAYRMSPAPRVRHQDLALNLASSLRAFLYGKPCTPFVAPVDVFLPAPLLPAAVCAANCNAIREADGTESVVQPDVLVVCDEALIEEDGVHGAPTFVAEILSPATAHKDLSQKKAAYERAGVKEYWLVNPDTLCVFRYVLRDGAYGPVTELLKGEAVESVSLPGFSWKAELREGLK